MGMLDKAKNLVGGNKATVKSGVDKAADVAGDKLGSEHADKVDKGAQMAKDAVDKLPE